MNIRRPARLLLPAAALLLAGTGCVGRGGGGSGSFRVAEVTGSVTVRGGDTGSHTLREGEDVPAGSVVRTGPDGFVRLTAGGGHAVELLGESQISIAGPARIALEMGRALGVAGPDRPLAVDSRGVSVRAAGGASTRIERLLGALRVAVYAGTARVELVGRGVDVPALRELVIAGGVPLERAPRPLTLSPADRWDKQLLGDVLAFDQDVSQFGRGFNAEFAGRVVAPEFFTPFVTVANLSFLRPQIPTSEPSEVLVGLVFATQLASRPGATGGVSRSFTDVLALRDQGASWGLIAKEKGLSLGPLRKAVLDAIRRGTTPPPGSTSGGGGSGGGSGSGGGGGGSSPGPRPSPRPSPSPSATPSPGPGGGDDECSLVERLLRQCSRVQTSGDGNAGAVDCSLIGVLLDPTC